MGYTEMGMGQSFVGSCCNPVIANQVLLFLYAAMALSSIFRKIEAATAVIKAISVIINIALRKQEIWRLKNI
ncbi:hypothetical protein ACSBR2_030837 [Camellia fascicularis]